MFLVLTGFFRLGLGFSVVILRSFSSSCLVATCFVDVAFFALSGMIFLVSLVVGA